MTKILEQVAVAVEATPLTASLYDFAAEQRLLSAILADQAVLTEISPLIRPRDFHDQLHGRLFEAILSLIESGSSVTPAALGALLNGVSPRQAPLNVPLYVEQLAASHTRARGLNDDAALIHALSAQRDLAAVSEAIARAGRAREPVTVEHIAQIDEIRDRLEKTVRAHENSRRPRISVVTPLYRSAPYIEELHRRLVATVRQITDDYEIILVNDGSPDDSLAIAKAIADRDPHVRVLDLSRNFGQHPATIAGLQEATGDYIYVCDSDLEDEPEWLKLFHDHLKANDCDVVYGVMTNKKGSYVYQRLRELFYFLFRLLSGVNFPTNVVPARFMSRRYLDALLSFQEHEVFLLGMWHAAGFKQLPFGIEKHDTSPSTYTFGRLANLFVNGLLSFSIRPLAAVAVIGVAISLLGCLAAGGLVIHGLMLGHPVPGWASIITATTVVGGVAIFLNGIIALYVAKIYLEVKGRPLAIVRQIYGRRPAPRQGAPRVETQYANVSRPRSAGAGYSGAIAPHAAAAR